MIQVTAAPRSPATIRSNAATAVGGERVSAVGLLARAAPRLRDVDEVLARASSRVDRRVEQRTGTRGDAPTGTGRAPQGFRAPTPTTLESRPLATVGTSFAPEQPVWQGSTTATPTVTGTYTGRADATFTFRVADPAAPGAPAGDPDAVLVSMLDEQGATVQTFAVPRSPGAVADFHLGNGLRLSLAAGEYEPGDSFRLQVSGERPASFDPGRPLRSLRRDGGAADEAVVDGSFRLNGVRIDVSADDRLADLLDRIDRAGAGVAARHDAVGDRVRLTSTTPGSGGTITLGDDTSGVLRALRLDGAVAVPGVDAGVAALDEPGAALRAVGLRHGIDDVQPLGLPAGAVTALASALPRTALRVTDEVDRYRELGRAAGRATAGRGDERLGFARRVDDDPRDTLAGPPDPRRRETARTDGFLTRIRELVGLGARDPEQATGERRARRWVA